MSKALTIIEGPQAGASFPLREDGKLILGRSCKCDVQLAHWSISRMHAELGKVGGHWFINDLGSRNGSFVNGSRVRRPRLLREGDQIRLAGITLAIQPVGQAVAQTSSPAHAGAGNAKLRAQAIGPAKPKDRLMPKPQPVMASDPADAKPHPADQTDATQPLSFDPDSVPGAGLAPRKARPSKGRSAATDYVEKLMRLVG